LSHIESEFLERLDQLINVEGYGNDAYRRFFIETFGKRFTAVTIDTVVSAVSGTEAASQATSGPSQNRVSLNNSSNASVAAATSFATFGANLLALLDSYLELSISLKELPDEDSYHDERVTAIIKLLRFLRDTGRK
jgi:hypothetical protein